MEVGGVSQPGNHIVAVVRASGRGKAKLRGRARGDEVWEARARRYRLTPRGSCRLVVVPVPAVCPISPVKPISPVSPSPMIPISPMSPISPVSPISLISPIIHNSPISPVLLVLLVQLVHCLRTAADPSVALRTAADPSFHRSAHRCQSVAPPLPIRRSLPPLILS